MKMKKKMNEEEVKTVVRKKRMEANKTKGNKLSLKKKGNTKKEREKLIIKSKKKKRNLINEKSEGEE